MRKKLNSIFIRGIIVLLPLLLTIFLLVWMTTKAENLFAPQVKAMLGEYYFTGFGILFTVFFIFLVGLLSSNFITGRLFKYFILKFERIPVVKAIYRPLKDFISLLGGGAQDDMNSVVLVSMPNHDFELIGLVTREDFDDFPDKPFKADTVAVYIPYSYFFGGCTLFVSRKHIKEIDIPADKALRMAITGYIKGSDTELTSVKEDRRRKK
jgi:uncharacterized membrane protein